VDDRCFDDLIQHVTSLFSRLRFGQALVIAGLVASQSGAPETEAKKRKERKKPRLLSE
jgi:hypothetical protein